MASSGSVTSDTSVKKVSSEHSPRGSMGQKYLASGVTVSMRMWDRKEPVDSKEETTRDYETVGYVVEGEAELYLEDQKLVLRPGDSWVVPKGARHRYRILEPFTAIEATSPPASAHGRDEEESPQG